MPQFDFFSFFVQIFWLSVGSIAFYLMCTKLFAGKIVQILKMRQKLNFFNKKISETSRTSSLYTLVIEMFFKKI